MEITINGECKNVPESIRISELIEFLEVKKERVAVELNRNIVSKNAWETIFLKTGDNVEIVHFVGGG
ncbi:MAG TPA: sulfur carrier protein ThiS [Acidobacteriota bacterium]|jgi:thiamine biosynthesis protein ThiS|nr:sulfur carrier protein ThiS [Acidobacteriota bacterium]